MHRWCPFVVSCARRYKHYGVVRSCSSSSDKDVVLASLFGTIDLLSFYWYNFMRKSIHGYDIQGLCQRGREGVCSPENPGSGLRYVPSLDKMCSYMENMHWKSSLWHPGCHANNYHDHTVTSVKSRISIYTKISIRSCNAECLCCLYCPDTAGYKSRRDLADFQGRKNYLAGITATGEIFRFVFWTGSIACCSRVGKSLETRLPGEVNCLPLMAW